MPSRAASDLAPPRFTWVPSDTLQAACNMAVLRTAAAALTFSLLASRLAAHAIETGCSADEQSAACQEAEASSGDSLLATRQDVTTQASAQEEAALQAASAVDEATKRMCKQAKIRVHKAEGLSAEVAPRYLFVKVGYRTTQKQDLTFVTKHVQTPPNPAVWDHTQEVLLCDKAEPLRFEVYDKGWVSNTFLAKAELDGREFWQEGFAGELSFGDGGEGHMQVTVQL